MRNGKNQPYKTRQRKDHYGTVSGGQRTDSILKLPQERRQTLLNVLAQDPRPGYQHEAGRVYGFPFAGFEVKFTVEGDLLTVRQIESR